MLPRAILLLSLFGLSSACPPPAPPKPKQEICGNGLDDNSDGKTDCADPSCFNSPSCEVIVEDCRNTIDDNRNGKVDCDDLDCTADPFCIKVETCGNGLDDNRDGKIDCADAECANAMGCGDGGPELGHCDDTLDNDNSGRADCLDSQCRGQACGAGCACTDGGIKGEADCTDTLDNDLDTKKDCADSDCAGLGCGAGCLCTNAVKTEAACADGLDNDGDTAIDCMDTDCATAMCGAGCACVAGMKKELACTDTLDNDGDTRADCADADCANLSCGAGCVCLSLKKTENNCTDGVDNDGDTKADCLDSPDCDGTSCGAGCTCVGGAKKEALCGDGVDNDADGLRDCADMPDCTAAAGCGNPASAEAGQCNDTIDNDNDGFRDCQDTDCNGGSCGVGCICQAGGKRETSCTDNLDNDGDTLKDCADPDCVATGTETCGDGLDNNCDRAVDCADPACNGNGSCVNLADGKPCALGSQCLGALCRTEGTTGWPSGACVSGTACTIDVNTGVSTGCSNNSSSTCVTDNFGKFCRQTCAAGCRPGYACHDQDFDSATPSACLPLCDTDASCAVAGSTYGCNPWSKLCEAKDKLKAKLGAACNNDGECETGECERGSGNGGYCIGLCRKAVPTCGGDGVCAFSSGGDGTGSCYDGCTTSAMCRPAPYTCRPPPAGAGSNVCYCAQTGDTCTTGPDCCTGNCQNLGFGIKVCGL